VKRHSTVPREKPPHERRPPKPVPRAATPKPATRDTRWARTTAPKPKRHAARLIDADDSTLLDVIDNLLSKGAVLNADLILALANVDLVYVRLTALLCAADRILKRAPR
jgi:hypothetical protein